MSLNRKFTFVAVALSIAVPALVATQNGRATQSAPPDVSPAARQLHERAIVIDTHDDTPQRLLFE